MNNNYVQIEIKKIRILEFNKGFTVLVFYPKTVSFLLEGTIFYLSSLPNSFLITMYILMY